MSKSYFNSALTGNSAMLCCFSDKGELLRLFWPNIGFSQHVDDFFTGIYEGGRQGSTRWFHRDFSGYAQEYLPGTNIVKTTFTDNEGLAFEQLDFVIPEMDVLVRRFTVENKGDERFDMKFMCFSSMVNTIPDPQGTMCDFVNDSIVHYRNGYYISVGADKEIYGFQLGNNPLGSAGSNEMKGFDNIGMMSDGAFGCNLGDLDKNQKESITLYICVAKTLKGSQELIRKAKAQTGEYWFEETASFWKEKLCAATKIKTANEGINKLYERTVLLFHLMSDKNEGGLQAAAEMDEHYTKCGRYGYCWGRDAAFITNALDICGLGDRVEHFFKWAARTQDAEGYWHQRYHIDGNLAPSWGMQIDETGSIVWGAHQHYIAVGDDGFLEEMWPCIKKAVEYMISFTDEETGLPQPSYDLWEERFGEHSYSAAAVYGGIKAGADIAHKLGKSAKCREWSGFADKLKESILAKMWSAENGCFIRSVKTKLNPWGNEYSGNTAIIRYNSKDYYKEVTLEDKRLDVSLLGLSIPFGVLEAKDSRMRSTAEQVERLLSFDVGGLGRYEDDTYIGGNPWIITTLWAALYHIEAGGYQKALEYLYWAADRVTHTGLLPEQASKVDGSPAWVFGLTWSHAMFILVLDKLLKAGYLKGEENNG
ncbi:MAG: glycoside hydrolase family 15 protein [Eubacteriales bacterium]|nr:glycoside hydrolase family 15 protein [Eubacteriales bacterium]